MWQNFLFSFNAGFPLLFFVLFGCVVYRRGFLGADFFPQADKFVFNIALPCMIFLSVYSCDVSDLSDFGLIAFSVVGITACVIVLCLLVPLILKDNAQRGAVIQGIYRSNFAVFGIPLAQSIAGDEGAKMIAVAMPFVIILFNAYAVIALSIFSDKRGKSSPSKVFLRILKNTVTNPLIIASVLGLLMLFVEYETGFSLPEFVNTPVTWLSNSVNALALMSLGASLVTSRESGGGGGKLKIAVAASVVKTVILPAVMVTIAALLGFRGARLAVIFVMFGAPSAIACYIMAKNMKSDAELAGQILVISTVMSLVTIFIGIFIIKSLGLIE
ncbi:MAG: AEC family transporter [Clostridiales bacterium]|nr:AEC family transporter [Clostridiales bacterium]